MAEVYAAKSVGASYCASCAAKIPAGLIMVIEGAHEYCPVCAQSFVDHETHQRIIAELAKRLLKLT